ncbi:MAG: hypothetical protein IT435_17635 [Phycisphaerales bacterium]|nr:hypothetical protein [Phycisphaerales bacterium]
MDTPQADSLAEPTTQDHPLRTLGIALLVVFILMGLLMAAGGGERPKTQNLEAARQKARLNKFDRWQMDEHEKRNRAVQMMLEGSYE